MSEICCGQGLQRLGGAAVGADAEAVVALDLHEVGGFVEDVGEALLSTESLYPPEACCRAFVTRAVDYGESG